MKTVQIPISKLSSCKVAQEFMQEAGIDTTKDCSFKMCSTYITVEQEEETDGVG